jgi:hypothetical protein
LRRSELSLCFLPVAFLHENPGEGLHVGAEAIDRVVTDAVTRRNGSREHGAVGRKRERRGRIGVTEERCFGGQRVEVGRALRRVAVAAEPVAPAGVYADEDHVTDRRRAEPVRACPPGHPGNDEQHVQCQRRPPIRLPLSPLRRCFGADGLRVNPSLLGAQSLRHGDDAPFSPGGPAASSLLSALSVFVRLSFGAPRRRMQGLEEFLDACRQ